MVIYVQYPAAAGRGIIPKGVEPLIPKGAEPQLGSREASTRGIVGPREAFGARFFVLVTRNPRFCCIICHETDFSSDFCVSRNPTSRGVGRNRTFPEVNFRRPEATGYK